MKRLDFFYGRYSFRSQISLREFIHITGLEKGADYRKVDELYTIDIRDVNESPDMFIFAVDEIPEFVKRFFLQNRLT